MKAILILILLFFSSYSFAGDKSEFEDALQGTWKSDDVCSPNGKKGSIGFKYSFEEGKSLTEATYYPTTDCTGEGKYEAYEGTYTLLNRVGENTYKIDFCMDIVKGKSTLCFKELISINEEDQLLWGDTDNLKCSDCYPKKIDEDNPFYRVENKIK